MIIETIIRDIGLYKDKLFSHIMSSPELCEVLLGKKNFTEDEVDELYYSQVFPYLYVDSTQDEVKSYVCYEVNVYKSDSGTIKSMSLIVWVYAHKDIMRSYLKGYSGTTVDILSDIVARKIQESTEFGIGKLDLKSVQYFFPNSKYYGRTLEFTTSDFKVKRNKR